MVELHWQGKLIRPPELSGNPTSSHLVAKKENWENEIIWPYKLSLFILRRDF
jgi:hypothetical protein